MIVITISFQLTPKYADTWARANGEKIQLLIIIFFCKIQIQILKLNMKIL